MNAYTCTGSISASDNDTSVITITGNHLAGRTNDDVTGFSIYNSPITNRLPRNINSFFPNLIAVDWVFGTLSGINSEDLRQFPGLRMLSLFGNQLTLLDSNVFAHNPSLEWIELSNNLITNVGDGLFNNLSNLTFVMFERNPCINFLATTPESILELNGSLPFECPAQLTIDCVYEELNWEGILIAYTCTGTVTGTGNIVLNIRGTHLTGRTEADVTGVSIYNSQVTTQFPRNVDNFFPNVEAFDWVFSRLSAVSAHDLAQFPALRMLSLFGNEISLLDGNLFANTQNLHWVDVSNNRITNVGDGVFANLTDLSFVIFQRNPCVDFLATTPEAIEELRLSLPDYCPAQLTIDCVYEELNWAGVLIAYTCTGTVTGTGSSVLNIRGTHLAGRSDADVAGVSIYNSQLTDRIPININSFFPNVRAFDWVFGRLTSISANDLRQFPGLNWLSVFGNLISSLDSNVFANTPRLQWLDLSDNRITNVGEGAFSILYELRWVIFQRNPCIDILATTQEAIWEMTESMEYQCPAQLTVDCVYEELNWEGVMTIYTCTGTVSGTGNRVLNMRGAHLPGRSNLDVVGVSIYNPPANNRIPGNFNNFFPTVRAFEWVFGSLTSLSANDLRQFPDLNMFSVFGNQLTSLDTNTFANNQRIQRIDLSSNQVTTVGDDIFQLLFHLQWVIFLRNPCIDFLATTPEALSELVLTLPFTCPAELTMDCTFEELNWAGALRAYTCTGAISGTGNRVLNVRGAHLPGRSNMDVTGLSIYNQQEANVLPANFDNFFPDVQAFDWVFGNLMSVSSQELAQFPGLLWLSLFGNQLTVLSSDMFASTPRLQWIDLSNNLITNVGSGLFSELYFLRWVFFQRNPCIDFFATTPESLSELIAELPYACPALDQGETCPASCLARIESLEDRVLMLESVISSIHSTLLSTKH